MIVTDRTLHWHHLTRCKIELLLLCYQVFEKQTNRHLIILCAILDMTNHFKIYYKTNFDKRNFLLQNVVYCLI